MGIFSIAIFCILAWFAGYCAIRSAALPFSMPLVAVISAFGSIVIVGALIVSAESSKPAAHYLGLAATVLAAINISGCFVLAGRMRASGEEKDCP